ncbi:MAG: hypothetical protein Q6363_005115, partial [Candidatus Njordarchaeota archaeon]
MLEGIYWFEEKNKWYFVFWSNLCISCSPPLRLYPYLLAVDIKEYARYIERSVYDSIKDKFSRILWFLVAIEPSELKAGMPYTSPHSDLCKNWGVDMNVCLVPILNKLETPPIVLDQFWFIVNLVRKKMRFSRDYILVETEKGSRYVFSEDSIENKLVPLLHDPDFRIKIE